MAFFDDFSKKAFFVQILKMTNTYVLSYFSFKLKTLERFCFHIEFSYRSKI